MKIKIILFLLFSLNVFSQTNSITSYEHWFDNNYSLKITSNISNPNETVSIQSGASISTLSEGLHSFNVRFKDSHGLWSAVKNTLFYKYGASSVVNDIVSYEFWFDDKYSQKLSNSVSPNDTVSIINSSSIESLGEGLHSFNVRFKDSRGLWSAVKNTLFYKYGASSVVNDIVSYEFWFDDKYSQKLSNSVSPNDIVSIINSSSIESLGEGLHSFNVRFKDSRGHWSAVKNTLFYKYGASSVVNDIVSYEFWFDDKYSQKLTNSVSPNDTVNIINNSSIESLGEGLHSFNVRFKDSRGHWSAVKNTLFYKYQANESTNLITTYRYWFDNNASALNTISLSTPLQRVDLLRNIIIPNFTPNTLHQFNVQFKDSNGNWSKVCSDTFTIGEGNITLSTPELLSPLNIANGISLLPTFSWKSSPAADSYIVELSLSDSFSNPLIYSGITDTNFSISNSLQMTTQYFWKVRAKCMDLLSDWSEVRSFTTQAGSLYTPVLQSPTNLAVGVSINPTFSWLRTDNANAYKIQISTSTDFNILVVNDITGNLNLSTNLNYLTEYYWRVQSINGGSASDWSEISKFTTKPATTNLNITALLTGLWSSNAHKAAAVTIELRTGGASVTSSLLYKRIPGLISSDGTINVNINNSQLTTNDYWLVVRSVGYLPVSSAQKVHIEVGQAFSYDFSRAISSVSSASMLKLIGDRYFLKVGDLNSDRNIQGGDMSLVKANSGNTNTVPILNNLDATNGTGSSNATLNLTTLLTGNWNGTVHKENAIMIELRTGTTLANSVVYKRIPALISATGEVSVSLTNFTGGDYWIIVRASGYVPISSAQKVTIPADATTSYDFSRSSSSVSSSSMLKASNGRYLMKVGDLNADRSVSGADMSAIKANSGGGSTIPGL